MVIKGLFCFSLAFVVAFLVSPFVFSFCRKIKASQPILHYVETHKSKQGTTTMGGMIFITGTIVSSFFAFNSDYTFALLTVITMLAYATLGFLDDFIKIKEQHNLGLKAYQKIIGQVGISLIIALYVFNYVGTSIVIPFSNTNLDLGIFIIPFIILFFVALVNSVNLIDGLDGLCSGVSIAYLLGFISLLSLSLSGLNGTLLTEIQNLILVCTCLVGALLAFQIFNGYPASIFMGDTGSLAIGGFISAAAVFAGYELYLLILGLPFVLTTLSDIIQVSYFKKTKKRVFLMAPIHHHFEKKGVNENKIVIVYIIITVMLGVLTYILTNYYGG
ncbi:MAG: phospho-N-acetylmuramoyl-pentapeptide-transferase [Clostridia bacterium]|nr:phospho-N-acetylmuramoyl-pentapeptide-transferase [Clostridia bacterium]MDD4686305.1 phospho-N-acetylmuramoyl-pentapeptide-transferase [Clostridia bacterium]